MQNHAGLMKFVHFHETSASTAGFHWGVIQNHEAFGKYWGSTLGWRGTLGYAFFASSVEEGWQGYTVSTSFCETFCHKVQDGAQRRRGRGGGKPPPKWGLTQRPKGRRISKITGHQNAWFCSSSKLKGSRNGWFWSISKFKGPQNCWFCNIFKFRNPQNCSFPRNQLKNETLLFKPSNQK